MTIHRQQLAHDQINVRQEMDCIVERAIERDARVVTLGTIVLFSTDTGDAWMLDSEEQWAMCLACSGDPQPAQVTETTKRFAIEWNLSYQIKGEQFIVADSSDRTRTILGYPMREIARAIQQAKLTGAAASDGRTSRGTSAHLRGLASLFKRDAQTEVAQQIKKLIKAGYDLLRGIHRQEGAACDQWLEAWALIKQVARSEMRTIATFDRFFHGQPVVANWVDDFDNELHNAGLDQSIYREHRLRYLRELLAQFPNENADAQVNFGRG